MIDKYITIGKYLGVALLILGIIHEIATFTPLIQSNLECLSDTEKDPILFFSLICGAFLILCGLLTYVLIHRIRQFPFLGLPILIIGIFVFINGALSVFYMTHNPFAWISFILGISLLGISILLRQK